MLFGIRQHAVKRKLERDESNRTRHIQSKPREQSHAVLFRLWFWEHRRSAEYVPKPGRGGCRFPVPDVCRQDSGVWPRSRSDALEPGLGGIEADAHHRTRIHAV